MTLSDALIRSIKPDDMQRYLEAQQWTPNAELSDAYVAVYETARYRDDDDQPIRVFMPREVVLRDYDDAVERLVTTLALLEQRPASTVAQEMTRGSFSSRGRDQARALGASKVA